MEPVIIEARKSWKLALETRHDPAISKAAYHDRDLEWAKAARPYEDLRASHEMNHVVVVKDEIHGRRDNGKVVAAVGR